MVQKSKYRMKIMFMFFLIVSKQNKPRVLQIPTAYFVLLYFQDVYFSGCQIDFIG